MSAIIVAYKKTSASARALSAKLQLPLHGKKVVATTIGNADHVINWGATEFTGGTRNKVINNTRFVNMSSDKRDYYSSLVHYLPVWRGENDGNSIYCLNALRNENDARRFFEEGVPLIARSLMRASGGRGMQYIDSNLGHDFVTEIDGQRVQVWVPYLKKTSEWRVHVGKDRRGSVGEFFVQQKRRKLEVDKEDVNFQIRNHNNGWVFCHNEIDPIPDNVRYAATNVLDYLGGDFGAVDVIYNQYHNIAIPIEVNTAPGLEGTTLDKYAEFFQSRIA